MGAKSGLESTQTGGWGGMGDREFMFNGCRISVWADDKDLEMDSGDSGKALLIANHWIVSLNTVNILC